MDRYYIAFHDAFDLIIRDYRKYKKNLEDKRLTHAEKLILQAHLLVRNNKNTEVFPLLDQCTPSNEYFGAHKDLVIGMAYLNTGQSQKALEVLENCESHFLPDIDHYFLFLLYRNCYTCALNLYNIPVAEEYFKLLMELGFKTPREERILKLTSFHHAILLEDAEKANTLKQELDRLKTEMSQSELPAYLINCFHLSMLKEDFKLAIEVMNEIKTLKKFHQSENYKFMHELTGYLMQDKPIYLREEDMSEMHNLNYQVQCIKALSGGDVQLAFAYWTKLQELNPQIYVDEFDYRGNKNLFALCLRKALCQTKQQRMEVPQDLSMFEKLDFIFANCNGVISKEELINLLWNQELYDKADLQKLSRLIYKYRKSTSKYDLQTHHGSYKIKENKAA